MDEKVATRVMKVGINQLIQFKTQHEGNAAEAHELCSSHADGGWGRARRAEAAPEFFNEAKLTVLK